MRILAIDPGYERLGVAILEKISSQKEILIYSDCFFTPKTKAHHERLAMVAIEVSRIIEEYKPTALSIETLFFSKNVKTALLVAEARGVVLAEASRNGLKVHEYNPADIKIAVTGYGKSDKQNIIDMVPKLIKISKKITYDDEYDAIAAGITFFATEKTTYPQK
ncbi:crossover junction endodeoxyribonuclease RuvC [Patescibacteria group bacterium]|nr:crossover junction endodeoxyribonuclease RuvC [Patescibacteria group bacterium]